MSKPPLIMIVGLGHSGTTILDAALGCSKKVVGLGEAARLLYREAKKDSTGKKMHSGRRHEVRCTCGQTAENCPVWSTISAEDLSRGSSNGLYRNLYQSVLDAAPETQFVVDSTPGGLQYLDHLQDFDIRVLMITRDIRSWATSNIRRRNESVYKSYTNWRGRTRAIESSISRNNLPCFKIGYEEFALRPKELLEKVCDWIGVPFEPEMLTPSRSTSSHIITGNRAARNPELFASINYDGSWLAKKDSPWLSGLLFAVNAAQNQRLVYSNGVLHPNP